VRKVFVFLLLVTISFCGIGQSLPKNYGTIKTKLFVSETQDKMLAVAFGGSEGGNVFASDQTKDLRTRFNQLGFSFLSVGYFGDKGLPKKLDRISLTAIYDTIQIISRRLKIKPSKILLVGASRGAELALNLSSRHDFMGVIALVAPSVSFPEADNKVSTSSWTHNDKEVPYLKLSYDLIKKNGWLKTIETELKNKENVESSSIKVENINGFVFLTSAKTDELWPSGQMCDDIISRLKANNFKFNYKHVSVDGGHQPSKHWDVAFKFIENNIASGLDE
jgi:uncharacterized protein